MTATVEFQDPDSARDAAADREAELAQTVRTLGLAVGSVDTAVGPWMDDTHDLPDMAAMLYAIREKRLRLAAVEAIIESHTARAMTSNKMEIPGWELTRRGGSKPVWPAGSIPTAVGWAIEARFTNVNGELPEGFDLDQAYAVRDLVLEIMGGAPRTTPLKELGVDFGELITREKSRRSVQVEPRAVDADV